ncbi:MAG TPA: lyase family protein [Chloroflexota bacterium]|nr:lyase family protein [Chloroflexota bacterium]
MKLEDAVSPLDYRYYGINQRLFALVQPYLSQAAELRYSLRVEAALARALARHGVCPPEAAAEIVAAAEDVGIDEVRAEEARVDHNIRAMVNCLQRRVSDGAKPYVHLFATSSDIMDTATAMRLRDFTHQALLPELARLVRLLISLAREHRDTLQIARTHGQHAVPITFGFAVAVYVERLGSCLVRLRRAAGELRGQLSGAVGAYNAHALGVADPRALERDVLAQLGLQAARISTQIVPPEPVVELVQAALACFGVLANLADDMRHLQRTEIAEIRERFHAQQVGSSTMPHKQNPWNFEHVKSMWKAFAPRGMTVLMDQISEHQRDLSNMASARFTPEILVGLLEALDRSMGLMENTTVDAGRMREHLAGSLGIVVAEPLYVLLALHGVPQAHELARRLAQQARQQGRSVMEVAQEMPEVTAVLAGMTPEQRHVLDHPEAYLGRAREQVDAVCDEWEAQVGK